MRLIKYPIYALLSLVMLSSCATVDVVASGENTEWLRESLPDTLMMVTGDVDINIVDTDLYMGSYSNGGNRINISLSGLRHNYDTGELLDGGVVVLIHEAMHHWERELLDCGILTHEEMLSVFGVPRTRASNLNISDRAWASEIFADLGYRHFTGTTDNYATPYLNSSQRTSYGFWEPQLAYINRLEADFIKFC